MTHHTNTHTHSNASANATSFADLKLIEPLARAIKDEGYTTPTPIQAQSIPAIVAGRDLLGCAQTGTGKTAAFVLPILQYLHENKKIAPRGTPRALILAPTRELAAQIADSIKAYGRYTRLTYAVIFGGVGFGNQIQALNRGVDILVATPGRLLDLMNQRHVSLNAIEVFVLDEADRMLDMGFIHDIKKVLTVLPQKRQNLFFSATFSHDVTALAKKMVHDPVTVTITPNQPTVERIKQSVLFVRRDQKERLLIELLKDPSMNRVVIFIQMKHVANKLAEHLYKAGIRSEAIHGNKSQAARTAALHAFKTGKVRALVATDVAARGLDIDGITHVINYELPIEAETYVHRIGRTARAGAEGDAISLVCGNEKAQLRDIQRFVKFEIPVNRDHPMHSEEDENASGSAARPVPRGQQRGFGPRPKTYGDRPRKQFGAGGGSRDGPRPPFKRHTGAGSHRSSGSSGGASRGPSRGPRSSGGGYSRDR